MGGKLRRGFAAIAVAALASSGLAVGTATPALASVRGLNLQQSGCDAQAPGTNIVLRQWNAYGWKCNTGLYDLNIDVNRACRWTYGPRSSAYYLDWNNPYSWRCR